LLALPRQPFEQFRVMHVHRVQENAGRFRFASHDEGHRDVNRLRHLSCQGWPLVLGDAAEARLYEPGDGRNVRIAPDETARKDILESAPNVVARSPGIELVAPELGRIAEIGVKKDQHPMNGVAVSPRSPRTRHPPKGEAGSYTGRDFGDRCDQPNVGRPALWVPA
jgi:hypothetical protein